MQMRKGRKRKKGCGIPRNFSGKESGTALPLHSRYNGGVRFRIRPFKKADFRTLWRIDQACFEPQLAYSQAELDFYMRRPGSFTLVPKMAPPTMAPKASAIRTRTIRLRANAALRMKL